jgi:hypothetical protein
MRQRSIPRQHIAEPKRQRRKQAIPLGPAGPATSAVAVHRRPSRLLRRIIVLRTILVALHHNFLYQHYGAVCRALRIAMTAIPAGAHFDYLLFAPAAAASPKEPADKLQNALTSLFPDLLVYGTRSHLLSMTTALTKVSGRAHQYFARLSQILAFERMMRSFFRFAASASPFFAPVAASSELLVSECWKRLFVAGGQPTQPAPWSHAPWSHAAWSHAPWPYAAPTPPSSAAASFLSTLFQPAAPASQPQHWPDYSAMFFLPMALWAAMPLADNTWSLAF